MTNVPCKCPIINTGRNLARKLIAIKAQSAAPLVFVIIRFPGATCAAVSVLPLSVSSSAVRDCMYVKEERGHSASPGILPSTDLRFHPSLLRLCVVVAAVVVFLVNTVLNVYRNHKAY